MENTLVDDEYLGIGNDLWSKLIVNSTQRSLNLEEKITERKMVMKTHLTYDQLFMMCQKLYQTATLKGMNDPDQQLMETEDSSAFQMLRQQNRKLSDDHTKLMKRIEILESEKKNQDDQNFSLEQKRLSEINLLN